MTPPGKIRLHRGWWLLLLRGIVAIAFGVLTWLQPGISAAALVLLFGAFAFAHILLMQFVAFGLAVAVFLDATLVRMILVPSFMQIAGRWNWWPGVRAEKENGKGKQENEG